MQPALLLSASRGAARAFYGTTRGMTPLGDEVPATITAVTQQTPTVAGLRLQVDPGSFSFSPGQWVDFFIPGVDRIGGYSICSTPLQLEQHGTIDLAVKRSRYPPAQWVHQQAAPGKQVEVRVGGDFVLQPDSLTTQASLFIAGGIGITALASMIGHIAEAAHVAGAESGRTAGTAGTSHQQQQRQQDGVGASGQQQPATAGGWHGGAGCALLLYSASSPEEFALLPQLLRWQQAARRRLRLQLHTTQGHGRAVALQQLREQASPGVRLLQHRLGISDLRAAIDQLRPLHAASTSAAAVSNAGSTAVVGEGGGTAREQAWLNAYVCGPQAMIDDMEAQLQQLGVTRVFSEKWW